MEYNFINREAEIKFLEDKFVAKGGKFIIFYGRRRVGKTELITHFLKGKEAVYFLADTSSRLDQIRSFTRLLADYLKDDFLRSQPLTGWDMVFSYLSALDRKLIIVLDEYPCLVREDHSLSSIIQKHWDLSLRKKDCTLVLLGSSISFMENQVLGSQSPLYGRRTGDWHVTSLGFKNVKKFYPDLSNEEVAKVYSILGGIPFYLNEWNPEIPFGEHLRRIIRKGSLFYNEPYFLMKEELSDPSNYFAVLKAIAKGERTLGKICSESGIESRSITKYLLVLERLRFVEREVPITENSLRKRGLYRISDPFLRFWFHYIFPNKNSLEQGKEDLVAAEILADFNRFMGPAFEDIARELLLEKFPHLQKLGRWWKDETEIDGVGIAKEEILFAEYKWSSLCKEELVQIYHALREKSGQLRTTKKKRYAIVCKKAAAKTFAEFEVFDLDDF